MADTGKVVINLATGLEDAERVTVAFLVAGAALERGNAALGVDRRCGNGLQLLRREGGWQSTSSSTCSF